METAFIEGRRLAKQSLARSFYRNSTMLLRGGGWASYRSLAKQSLAWQKRAIIEEHRGGFLKKIIKIPKFEIFWAFILLIK